MGVFYEFPFAHILIEYSLFKSGLDFKGVDGNGVFLPF